MLHPCCGNQYGISAVKQTDCVSRCLLTSVFCLASCPHFGCAGGDDEGFKYYRDCIAEVSGRYEKVLMLGDSMGEPFGIAWSFPALLWVSCEVCATADRMQSWIVRLRARFMLRLLSQRRGGVPAVVIMCTPVCAVPKHDWRRPTGGCLITAGGTAALLFSALSTSVHAFTPQVHYYAEAHRVQGLYKPHMTSPGFAHCSPPVGRPWVTQAAAHAVDLGLQVNLEESSIRPGRPLEWHRHLKARICGEVAAAAAAGSDVHIHVGNWLHDLRQARTALLYCLCCSSCSPTATPIYARCPCTDCADGRFPAGVNWPHLASCLDILITMYMQQCLHTEARLRCWLQARIVPKQHATLEIYHMDSHRLAFYLDADGQLVPLIQRALKRVRA